MMKPFVTEPHEYLEPRIGKEGVSAWPARTVIEVFQSTVERFPHEPALLYKQSREGKVAKEYTKISYRNYWELCMKFAKTLVKLNIPTFEIINILGFNSPEWFIANMGAILAGCIAAGIYTTNLPDACRYITHHSKAPIVVLEGNKQLQKYTEIIHSLPALKVIVVWGEAIDPEIARRCAPITVFSWKDFLHHGQDFENAAINSRWAAIRPGNCCTIIYTSGTTGPPKATMISHDNITWTARNVIEHYIDLNHTDRIISYLPLSHIAGQIIDLHAAMTLGASTWFAQPDALKGSLTTTLKEVRPTIFFGVPRVWEKIEEKMVQLGRETPGLLRMVSS